MTQKYRRLDLPYHMESSVLDQVYKGVDREVPEIGDAHLFAKEHRVGVLGQCQRGQVEVIKRRPRPRPLIGAATHRDEPGGEAALLAPRSKTKMTSPTSLAKPVLSTTKMAVITVDVPVTASGVRLTKAASGSPSDGTMVRLAPPLSANTTHDFREAYRARWSGDAFDSSHYYFDAMLLTAFALQRSAYDDGDSDTAAPTLAESFYEVSSPPGILRVWTEAEQTITALREGERAYYVSIR